MQMHNVSTVSRICIMFLSMLYLGSYYYMLTMLIYGNVFLLIVIQYLFVTYIYLFQTILYMLLKK